MRGTGTALLAAMLAAALPVSASAQQTPAQATEDAAKLAEAHAIIEIIIPAAERDATVNKLLDQFAAQFRQSLPPSVEIDPGIKAIVDDYLNRLPELVRPVVQQHMPLILEAEAIAYAHEFSLAELKDIHAFGQTPSGQRYLSHSAEILGDPAVAKANSALMADTHTLAHKIGDEVAEKVAAYVDAHPEVLKKLEAATKK